MDSPESQRIMVVDDDPFVREAIDMILAGDGHAVRATANGAEALQWLEDGPCDLLILDLKMPEIDGPTLYKRVLTRWAGASPAVLFVSGYADLGAYHDDPALRGLPVLVKPFSLDDLRAAVQQALATV